MGTSFVNPYGSSNPGYYDPMVAYQASQRPTQPTMDALAGTPQPNRINAGTTVVDNGQTTGVSSPSPFGPTGIIGLGTQANQQAQQVQTNALNPNNGSNPFGIVGTNMTGTTTAPVAPNYTVNNNSVNYPNVPSWNTNQTNVDARTAAYNAILTAKASGDMNAFQAAANQYAANNGGNLPSWIAGQAPGTDYYAQQPAPPPDPVVNTSVYQKVNVPGVGNIPTIPGQTLAQTGSAALAAAQPTQQALTSGQQQANGNVASFLQFLSGLQTQQQQINPLLQYLSVLGGIGGNGAGNPNGFNLAAPQNADLISLLMLLSGFNGNGFGGGLYSRRNPYQYPQFP